MKRAGFLLLMLVLLGLLSAPAHAAQPAKVKAVEQSRAEVVAYWTAERMRSAIPLDAARAAGGKKQLAYPFTRYEPGTYNPAHGKVFFSDGASNYVCSGTALTSGNESVVWTAGHCVNQGPGAFYTNWAFVPAYKDGARPYGTWTARALLTTSAWGQGGDFSYDLGAAVVNTSGGATLTDTVGSRGIAFNQPAQQHYLSHGYPAAAPVSRRPQLKIAGVIGNPPPATQPPPDEPPVMSQPMPMVGGFAEVSRVPRSASQTQSRPPLNGGAAG